MGQSFSPSLCVPNFINRAFTWSTWVENWHFTLHSDSKICFNTSATQLTLAKTKPFLVLIQENLIVTEETHMQGMVKYNRR